MVIELTNERLFVSRVNIERSSSSPKIHTVVHLKKNDVLSLHYISVGELSA